MMYKFVVVIIVVLSLNLRIIAQNDEVTKSNKLHVFDVSLGIGYMYGGVAGFSASIFPVHFGSIFFSTGFVSGITLINTGLQLNLLPHSEADHIRAHLKLLYVTNSICYYYKPGTSIIIGFETRFNKKKNYGIDVDFAIPASKTDNKENLGVFNQLSIGYHFEF